LGVLPDSRHEIAAVQTGFADGRLLLKKKIAQAERGRSERIARNRGHRPPNFTILLNQAALRIAEMG
jgi:hypothetical protein